MKTTITNHQFKARLWGCSIMTAAALLWQPRAVADAHFAPVATYQVSGEVAEIVTASPDGQWLFYTDSASQQVGVVNIQN